MFQIGISIGMAGKKASKSLHDYLHFALRIVLGWTMLWAFLDKTFGLGFATKQEASWLNGGSPTTGFLKFAAKGPFAEIFQGLAGNQIVDWLFMMGLLGVGIAFILGIALRFAGFMGALMMLLMYLALLQPQNNPITDDHIINLLAFLLIGTSNAGEVFGFGQAWKKSRVVKVLPFLK